MNRRLLNRKKIDKICANCAHGRHTPGEDGVLCLKKGVMTNTSTCRKFEYDPLNRTPARPLPLQVPNMEEFEL